MEAPLRSAVNAVREVLAATYDAWRADRVVRLGAGLAYYGLFALVPTLTLGVVLAGIVFNEAEVQQFLADRLADFFGADVDTSALVREVSDVVGSGGTQIGLGIISVVGLLVAASVVFLAFQDALNVIFHVPARRGIEHTLRRRVVAFGIVLLTGSLLVASFAIHSVSGLLQKLVPGDYAVLDSLADLLGTGAMAGLGTLVLALLLRVLPGTAVRWRHVLVGAAITACFVALGAWVFGAYTERFGVRSVGGAAGGLFVALLFIYYEAQIILAGAVLTKVLHERSETALG